MTITVYKQKTIDMNFKKKIQKKLPKKKKNLEKKISLTFFLQNHEMRPKIESQNSWDHEL
jgi:uncharacterized membrane protein YgaE (UPF0421/DUF939 family)